MIQCAYRFCLYHNCNCVSHIKNDTSPYIALGSASCNVMACGLLQLWEHLSLLFMVDLETKTLQGAKSENSLSSPGIFLVDNSSVEFQKYPGKENLSIAGPLTADFIVKVSPFRYLVFKALQTDDVHNLLKREL